MEATESVSPDTSDLSSSVEVESEEISEGGLEESSDEGLPEINENEYTDSDLSSLDAESFEQLKQKVFSKKEESLPEKLEEKREEGTPENAEVIPEPLQQQGQVQDPSAYKAEEDPQLRETLVKVGQSYQGLESREKQLAQQVYAARTRANELSEDNPREAVKFDQKAEELERELQNVSVEKRTLETYAANLSTVPKAVPPQFLKPGPMIEAIQESHGFTPEQARDYVSKMMYTRPANEIISLATQAMYREALLKVLPQLEAMQKGNTQTKAKSSNEVAKIINKAKSIPKSLTPVPTSSDEPDIGYEELALMSNDEFDKLKKQVLRNG